MREKCFNCKQMFANEMQLQCLYGRNKKPGCLIIYQEIQKNVEHLKKC